MFAISNSYHYSRFFSFYRVRNNFNSEFRVLLDISLDFCSFKHFSFFKRFSTDTTIDSDSDWFFLWLNHLYMIMFRLKDFFIIISFIHFFGTFFAKIATQLSLNRGKFQKFKRFCRMSIRILFHIFV